MDEPCSILLAEPDAPLAGLIRSHLQQQGYAVHVAGEARQALEAIENEGPPDLLVTDRTLPDMDGLELIQCLSERFPHLYAIVLNDGEPDPQRHPPRRVQCLAKPLELAALDHAVIGMLVRHEAERMHEEWMSAITHDLKIPLTSILGCCAMLLGPDAVEESRRRQMISCIQRNGQRVRAMLDNHLTMSRAHSGQLELSLEDVSPARLVEDLSLVMQFEAERRESAIDPVIEDGVPRVIRADEQLVQRALGNLLSNAIKYSPWECRIEVRVRPRPIARNGESIPGVEFAVSNPGRGIPPEDLPHIFDRYRRVHNIRGIEGVGLGLSVVKTVAEVHEGRAEAESVMNEFTCFRLILPQAGPAGEL